jgi:outer membrane protein OmpA-like peptidoglycan-associated protein
MKKAILYLCPIVFLIFIVPSNCLPDDKNLISEDDIIKKLEKPSQETPAIQKDTKKKGYKFRSIVMEPVEKEKPEKVDDSKVTATPLPKPSVTVYLYFKYGSTDLADTFSERQLSEIGKALSSPALSKALFEIGGHTDSRGSDYYNLELSRKRAERIKEYLCLYFKIDPARLITKGYGELMPAYPNDTPEERAKNRRVVIKRLD